MVANRGARDDPSVNLRVKHFRCYLTLSLVACLSFLLNLLVSFQFQGLNAPPKSEANPDQVEYELFAYQLSTGCGYTWPSGEVTACRPPGTSLTLLPVYFLFGRSFIIARIWFCFLAALTCLETGWLAWQIGGPAAALAAAAFLALYPGHFYYSMHFLSEVPFGLWLALACGFALASIRSPGMGHSLIAGGFWGLAVLTRPQTILVAPIALICLIASGSASRTRYMKLFAAQLFSAALVIAPWVARNAIMVGKPALCTIVGGYTFWGAHNDIVAKNANLRGSWIPASQLVDKAHPLIGDEIEREASAWRYGKEFIMTNPEELPLLFGMKIVRVFSPLTESSNRVVRLCFAVGWLLTAPLLAIGILIAAKRNPAATVILAIPCLATLATALIFYGSDRFRDGVSPVWMVFVGVALGELYRRWAHAKLNSSEDQTYSDGPT
jgi:4-amino-4-deoxy-L-arabinose transferase-like glycosyltransferase